MAETRKYASFFEWKDKARKELGVVEELVNSLNEASSRQYKKPRINKQDPPDCVCLDENENSVAIEVVEVVSEYAARLNAQGKDVVRIWRSGELQQQVSKLLAEKDKKKYLGGPYKEIVICLFTDEPMLELEFAKKELASSTFGPFDQIDSAFLVFSYCPKSKIYPVVPICINT